MKRIIAISLMAIICFCMGIAVSGISYSTVDGITEDNYSDYEKPIQDSHYGFNKNESDTEYLPYEEYFYNEVYDHYNVDLVYDESVIPQEYKDKNTKEEENEIEICPYCGQEIK